MYSFFLMSWWREEIWRGRNNVRLKLKLSLSSEAKTLFLVYNFTFSIFYPSIYLSHLGGILLILVYQDWKRYYLNYLFSFFSLSIQPNKQKRRLYFSFYPFSLQLESQKIDILSSIPLLSVHFIIFCIQMKHICWRRDLIIWEEHSC